MEKNSHVKKGKLIIISGPSGVGKGTVRQNLFERKDLNLAYSISCTTRIPRIGETHGEDYYFVNESEFLKLIDEGKFLEWTNFVGNYYGTPEDYVDKMIASGKNIILEIETDGAEKVMAKRPDAITIFLMPPSLAVLEQRIRQRRSEDEETIQKRLTKAQSEIKSTDKYQYVVTNETVDKAAVEIGRIIKSYQ